MSETNLEYLSAHDAARLISEHELSSTELTGSLLARIEEQNPRLNAFLTVTPERAMSDAGAADDRAVRGRRIGPLDGVPHSIKDVEPTQGIRSTAGSLWNRNRIPDHDSVVAARMRAAGSPLLGKTNVSHAGYKDQTTNYLGPPARNPWDLKRTPGGSSGGAGSAVAAGLGALAQGGDGGGSIRIPASFTGLVGFKPSFGRIPQWPGGDSFTSKGSLTRTVLDAALMLNAIVGPDSRDPLSIDTPSPDFIEAARGTLKGLKVGWSPDFGHIKVAPDVADSCARAASTFSALGCEVSEVAITWGGLACDVWMTHWEAAYAQEFAGRLKEHRDWIEPTLQTVIAKGGALTAVDLQRAFELRTQLYERIRLDFERYDLLLSPTMPNTAWHAEEEPETPLQNRVAFTCPFNLTGQPAVSVPSGFDRHGRPIGLQIVAGWHRDALALSAAARFEEASPWPIRPHGF